MMVVSQGVQLLQHKSFSPPRIFCTHLAGPAAIPTPSACCFTAIRNWPASLGSSKLQLQYTGGWNASCSCTFFFVLIFAISHDSLTPLMRHCLPDASLPCTKHFALCSSFALKWPASWPTRHQLAVYCRLECSVQSHLSSYWQCDRSCFSWCRRCASVCLPPA